MKRVSTSGNFYLSVLSGIDMSSVFTARCRWEKPVNTIQINGLAVSLAFHAFDPHLVIANESDMITYVTSCYWIPVCPCSCALQCVGLDQAEETKQILQWQPSRHEHNLAAHHQSGGGRNYPNRGRYVRRTPAMRPPRYSFGTLYVSSGRYDTAVSQLRPFSVQWSCTDGQCFPGLERGAAGLPRQRRDHRLETDWRDAHGRRRLSYRPCMGCPY